MSAIVIAGLGIHCPGEVTGDVQRLVREVDIVFHSLSNTPAREWIESKAREARDLNYLYTDGRPRIDAYRAMSELIIARAAAGASVMFAVYGHPCVLHTGVQLTLRAAAQRKIPTQILPGISSIDGMLAAVGIDFGFGGLQVLEASDMVMYGRVPQIEGHVVILQVAIVGPRVHRADGHRGTYADYLIRRLITLYPPNHPTLHFRLAATVLDADLLIWTKVNRLKLERWSNASSLYLPPARGSQIDTIWAERFGAPA